MSAGGIMVGEAPGHTYPGEMGGRIKERKRLSESIGGWGMLEQAGGF
jgi:hypothetical protein